MTTLAPFDQAKPAGLGSTMSSTPATGLATQTVTAAAATGGKDTCLLRRETSARAAPHQLRRIGERLKLRVARRMYAGGGGGVRPVGDGGRLLGAGDTQTMRQASVSLALTFRRHCRGLCGRLACVCTCIRAHWRFGFVVRVVTPARITNYHGTCAGGILAHARRSVSLIVVHPFHNGQHGGLRGKRFVL